MRPVWAEINLDNLGSNIASLRKLINPAVKIMAVVKSNAYGHGALKVGKKLVSLGVEYLAVATVDEGIELRSAGIDIPVVILGASGEQEIDGIIAYKLTPTVFNEELAKRLNQAASNTGTRVKLHIRVDTETGNFGLQPQKLIPLLKKINGMEQLEIEGIYTHLYSTYGTGKHHIDNQVKCFESVLEALEQNGIHIPLVHAASTPAIISLPDTHYNMIRPGNIIYGLPPERDHQFARDSNNKIRVKLSQYKILDGFMPVMQLKAKIADLKLLTEGSWLGYSDTIDIIKPVTIATIPFGYADGFPFVFLDNCEVLVRGKRTKVFGKVLMDYFMIDVTNIPDVSTGDEVVIIGKQENEEILVEEIAACARIEELDKDNRYNIMKKRLSQAGVCLLDRRIPRVYIGTEL